MTNCSIVPQVENLEDALKYKEDEIAAMTNTAASLSANQNSVDSLVAGLHESLNGKEKQIERSVNEINISLLGYCTDYVYFMFILLLNLPGLGSTAVYHSSSPILGISFLQAALVHVMPDVIHPPHS